MSDEAERARFEAFLCTMDPREQRIVRGVWDIVASHFGDRAPLPMITGANDPSPTCVCWSRKDWTLDFEIVADGFEWFYRDRRSGRADGSEVATAELPDQFWFLLGKSMAEESATERRKEG